MKVYKTITEYLQYAEKDDRIVFSGRGGMDGIKALDSKFDTYVYTGHTADKIKIKPYRSKKMLCISSENFNQSVAVLSESDFKQLA